MFNIKKCFSYFSFVLICICLLFSLNSCGGGGGGGGAAGASIPADQYTTHNPSGWGGGGTTTDGGSYNGQGGVTVQGGTSLIVTGYIYNGQSYSNVTALTVALKDANAQGQFTIPFTVAGETTPRTARVTKTSDGYKIEHQYKAVCYTNDATGTSVPTVIFYYIADGINLSAYAGTTVQGWQCSNGTTYNTNIITGVRGDITFQAIYPGSSPSPNPPSPTDLGTSLSGSITLYRYCQPSSVFIQSSSFSITSGTPPFTAVPANNAITTTVSGSNVTVAVNANYGQTNGQRLTDSATANGASITVVLTDANGLSNNVTVKLVDCIGNDSSGIVLNTANTVVANNTIIPDIPGSIGGVTMINGETVGTTLSNGAFTGSTSVSNLTLPSCINTINAGSYNETFPDNSTGSFANSHIQSLTATGVTNIGEAAFTNSHIETIELGGVRGIGKGAFSNCSGLTSINLSSIATMGGTLQEYAFANCSNLDSVTWGSYSQSSIPQYAFKNSKLSNTVISSIPAGVNTIAAGAFNGCTGLTEITIPNTITTIGVDAFAGCPNLTKITLPNNNTQINTFAFENNTNLQTVVVQNSTFAPSDSISSSSSAYMFQGCTGLQYLDLTACDTVNLSTKTFDTIGNVAHMNIKVSSNLQNLTLRDTQNLSAPLTICYEGPASEWPSKWNSLTKDIPSNNKFGNQTILLTAWTSDTDHTPKNYYYEYGSWTYLP